MQDNRPSMGGYILAAALGTFGGGLLLVLAARVIPGLMSRTMSGMMEDMMAQIAQRGCSPVEF